MNSGHHGGIYFVLFVNQELYLLFFVLCNIFLLCNKNDTSKNIESISPSIMIRLLFAVGYDQGW
jgi:hypothetical protein